MGELHPFEPRQSIQEALEEECAGLHDELSELLKKFKGQSRELAELRRDKLAEAEESPNWPVALRLFKYHNRVFGHETCRWSYTRFAMVEALLAEPDGLERALRAISGHRRDAWSIEKGRTLWEHVFESQKALEGAILRCPKNWQPPPGYEKRPPARDGG